MSTILPSASSSKAGVLSTGTQTVAGDKTFSGAITFTGAVTGITANPADQVTQASHGFAVGTVLYHTGSAYARAIASASASAEILGMVSGVLSANSFELTFDGKVSGLTGLTAGTVYFLSDSAAGTITATEPSTVGTVSMPIGIAISTTQIYVKSSRGAVVGGSNARTEIALANNTVTNVQSVAAYQAGELTGWVEIDGSPTDYKFYVAAPFARNGAGTDYNISPQYVGDTVPVGFSITVTTAGLIQATLPSIAGYVSAKINFSLNAPAVGATFPLAIDSTAVQFSTLKAKDSGGFVFQENDGGQIGAINDTGAWTLTNRGTSGSARTIATLNTVESANGTGGNLDFAQAGTVVGRIQSIYESGGQIGLRFSSFNSGLLQVASATAAGAWTIGPASGAATQTITGKLQLGGTLSGTAVMWVQTGGTTGADIIADFRTGTNSAALQIYGNASVASPLFFTGSGITASNNGNQNTTLVGVDGNGTYLFRIAGNGDAGYSAVFTVMVTAGGINSFKQIGHATLSLYQVSASVVGLTTTGVPITQTYTFTFTRLA